MISQDFLKIGEVATQSGLPTKTVRYYDDIGLLTPTVERSDAGYRLFKPEILERLSFIRRAQSLGLSLNEVKEILSVHDQGRLPCREVKQQIQHKVQEITQQIEQLQTLQSELQTLLASWQEEPQLETAETLICPNLEASMKL
jgi:MerR family transcriptional regulator, copper efflux regulator